MITKYFKNKNTVKKDSFILKFIGLGIMVANTIPQERFMGRIITKR